MSRSSVSSIITNHNQRSQISTSNKNCVLNRNNANSYSNQSDIRPSYGVNNDLQQYKMNASSLFINHLSGINYLLFAIFPFYILNTFTYY